MKILVVTQVVDRYNPVLGFFHRWLEEFSKNFEKVTVICLERGEYDLPGIKVLSLGKEGRASKAKYLFRFYTYIWHERNNYDAVFVHMNQEYVLLGWWLWRLFGKRIYLWRNHAMGTVLTNLAVMLSRKVFYTSPSSYTAKFKKSINMPVGIDTNFFKPDTSTEKITGSYLFLGRIAPVKKVLEFVEWFNTLPETSTATVAGGTLPQDASYEKLVKRKASARIKFIGSVTHEEALRLYRSHETFVNLTPEGSYDKTIFEAAACGNKIIVANKDLKDLEHKTSGELRSYVVENHSLYILMNKLKKHMQ